MWHWQFKFVEVLKIYFNFSIGCHSSTLNAKSVAFSSWSRCNNFPAMKTRSQNALLWKVSAGFWMIHSEWLVVECRQTCVTAECSGGCIEKHQSQADLNGAGIRKLNQNAYIKMCKLCISCLTTTKCLECTPRAARFLLVYISAQQFMIYWFACIENVRIEFLACFACICWCAHYSHNTQ